LNPVTNNYIIQQIQCFGVDVHDLDGIPSLHHACLCCGRCTLATRNDFSICKVCWWEDDGQDNSNANETYGGPNYGINLAEARYNYIKYRICDPSRTDLVEIQEPAEKYVLGRKFFVTENGYLAE
jgi:hypothetical protein